MSAGQVTAVVQQEFGLSQPGVSQHLRVLRENGFARVRSEGARRLYAVDPAPLHEVARWLDRFGDAWDQRLDALATELARGRRQRRRRSAAPEPPGEGPAADTEEHA
jgi:DNA-binding transcriptional ArsR family regulator